MSSFSSKGSGSGTWMIGACSACGSVTPEVEGMGPLGVVCGGWDGPSGWS